MTDEDKKELNQLLSYQRTISFGFVFMIIFNLFMLFCGYKYINPGWLNCLVSAGGFIFIIYLYKENKKAFKRTMELLKK
jgi:hypothetical protein